MNPGTVLFADDGENDRLLFRLATQDAKWLNRLVEFEDGGHLIEYLDHSAEELPVLVVLDIKMGDVSGLGVLKWMRKRRELDVVPTVILSSSCLESDIREAKSLGVVEYRVKPVKYLDLVITARELRERWLDRPPPCRESYVSNDLKEHRKGGSRSRRR